MHQLCFHLAGLRFRLRSDAPVSVGGNVEPFLEEDAPGQDVLLQINAVEALPPIPSDALFAGPAAYCREGEQQRIFHLEQPGALVQCMTRLDGQGNAAISYLPQYAHCVSGTTGVLNRMGLDSLLLQCGALLLHAALVRHEGRGVLFTGPSGMGKSTQARLWQQLLGADILNGDRAVLRSLDGRWTAWGLPLAGTSRIFRNENAPLSALVVLRQAKENRLRRLSPREAFAYVFPELSLQRWDRETVDRAVSLFLRLAEQIPVYLLECLPDEAAVTLLRDTLEKERLP